MHAFFRHIIPGVAVPFPSGAAVGHQLTITGAIQPASIASRLPIFVPKDL
jgi:hypothetical protein